MMKRIAAIREEMKERMNSVSVSFAEDHGSDYGCIEDSAHEWIDSNVSIYYSDILEFIREHVEEVERAISEFGWEGCGSDLYKAAQTGEAMYLYDIIYSDQADIIAYVALQDAAIRTDSGVIDADLWADIENRLWGIEIVSDWEEIHEAVRDAFAEYEEKREQIIDAVEKAAAAVVDTISGTSAPAPAVI